MRIVSGTEGPLALYCAPSPPRRKSLIPMSELIAGLAHFMAISSRSGMKLSLLTQGVRMRGHCLCGTVAFEVDGSAQACVSCHCESCRRQCSAPMTTYIGVLDGQWRWLGKTPKVFNLLPVWKEHFAITVARRCPSAQRTCPVSCIFLPRRWRSRKNLHLRYMSLSRRSSLG